MISNMITKPCAKATQPPFNVNDNNIFSCGQVDVFFDRCYQKRNNWVFMEGQGRLSNEVILSTLILTNIVFIHFNFKELDNNEESLNEL